MQRLFLLFRKYNFIIFFIVFETIAFSFLIRSNSYHHSLFFSTLQELTGVVYQKYSNALRYFSLRKENDLLLEENSVLHSKLSSAYSKLAEAALNTSDTNLIMNYIYHPANVINNTTDKRYNFLTLNVGTKQGVDNKMGVISKDGIVGKIISCSDNFSLVISILNGDFKLNAKIQEINEVGSIAWDGGSPNNVLLQEVPNHVKVKIGQHVLVGPYSYLFPENFPIGIIVDYKLPKGASFYTIYVRLNTSIKNNTDVYVIKKLNLAEQLDLEKKEVNEQDIF
jgi:rod shape-determining protein MreC